MDELTIEGELYISSKRAARISGYTKDYIGQLCRAGSLPSKMVGRSWYVKEHALKEHRKTYKGEPVLDSSIWDVDQIEESGQSLQEVAKQYVDKQEEGRRNSLISELFKLNYEKEDGPFVPDLIEKEQVDENQDIGDFAYNLNEGESDVDSEIDFNKSSFVNNEVDEDRVFYTKKVPPSSHVLSLRNLNPRNQFSLGVGQSAGSHNHLEAPTYKEVKRLRAKTNISESLVKPVDVSLGSKTKMSVTPIFFVTALLMLFLGGSLVVQQINLYVNTGTKVQHAGQKFVVVGLNLSILSSIDTQAATLGELE